MTMASLAPTDGAEGDVGAAASFDSGSIGVHGVESAAVVSGSAESLEGVVDDQLLLPRAVTVESVGDDGVEDDEEQLSPVRQLDASKHLQSNELPTDAQIFEASKTLTLKRKDGQTIPNVSFLCTSSSNDSRLAPLSIYPLADTWRSMASIWKGVIYSLMEWHCIMSLAERTREQKKWRNLSKRDRRPFQLNVEELLELRPISIDEVTGRSAVPQRLSIRTVQRGEERATAALVERSLQLASDPERQERARRAALGDVAVGDNVTRRRTSATRAAAAAAAVAPVDIVGIASSQQQRDDVVQQRQERRQGWKKRKTGDNCNTIGMQGDATSTGAVNQFHKVAAKTVETLHYPHAQPGDLTHSAVAISFNQLSEYNSNGGRSSSNGRKASKPNITITAGSRADAIMVIKKCAEAIGSMKDVQPSDGVYELNDMILTTNFKSDSSNVPLQDDVQRRNNENYANTHARPSRNRPSMGEVQRSAPAGLAVEMSPGARDDVRPMDS